MWLKEHKSTVAIVSILIVFGVLVAMSFRGDDTSGIKGKTQGIVAIVEKPLSEAVNGLKKGCKGLFGFRKTGDENKKLEAENKKLQQENANLKLKESEYKELKALSALFKYSTIQHEDFLAANVVSVDHSNWMQVFTIDKGKASGITEGKIVMDGNGIIGRVSEVTSNSSKVVSLVDESSKTGFQLERDESMMGVLQGNGKAGLSGYLLDGNTKVKKGDTLITSGIGNYPKGLKIAKITKVEKNKGTQSVHIQAEPSVKFSRIQKVAVML